MENEEINEVAIKDLPPDLQVKALNTMCYQLALSVGREPFIRGDLLSYEDCILIFKNNK
jgi:hypothetical protein